MSLPALSIIAILHQDKKSGLTSEIRELKLEHQGLRLQGRLEKLEEKPIFSHIAPQSGFWAKFLFW